MPPALSLLAPILPCAALAMLVACAPNTPPASSPVTGPIERAGADDCAILVAVGRSELKWGSKPPAAALLADYPKSGGGSWREDCAWNELGVAAPAIGDSRSPAAFFVTRPTYSGTHATAFFQYSVASIRLPDGSILPPFLERERCSLEKRAGAWHLLACNLTGLTP